MDWNIGDFRFFFLLHSFVLSHCLKERHCMFNRNKEWSECSELKMRAPRWNVLIRHSSLYALRKPNVDGSADPKPIIHFIHTPQARHRIISQKIREKEKKATQQHKLRKMEAQEWMSESSHELPNTHQKHSQQQRRKSKRKRERESSERDENKNKPTYFSL